MKHLTKYIFIKKLMFKNIINKNILKFAVLGIVATLIASVFFIYIIQTYIINQAEKNIQNLLLSHRGMHHYIQRVMHPAFYEARKRNEIRETFYSPEILSSSYIVRNQHVFYNDERNANHLPEVYYKMAADNPRNPKNKADEFETNLIEMFNADRALKEYRKIITKDDRRYLLYAIPFLENEQRCLKCHGNRAEAPYQLQTLYPGEGGFNEKVGRIRAIESIRTPLESEYYTVYVASASLITGFVVMFGLIFFNRKLSSEVKDHTQALENEIQVRKEAQQKLNQLNEELEHRVLERTNELAVANKELDAFAYSVSHDLRAPLRAIDGFSQALQEDYLNKIDADGQDFLHRIRQGSKKMAQLIDDMLKLSRLTRSEINKKSINLSQIVKDITNNLCELNSDRNCEFIIQENVFATADRVLIESVLVNLLNNAWKFSKNKEKTIIEFGSYQDNNRLIFFIKDNGDGFDMQYADKLFLAFQRLHTTTQFEGCGIGLASVNRIIQRHGGKIWADSIIGQGANFYFYL